MLAALDDLYRPYRPKRRTRASIAREKGLEPLAAAILAARTSSPALEALAKPYIDPEKGVGTAEDALVGAGDIIAGGPVGRRKSARPPARAAAPARGVLKTVGTDADDTTYAMYHDFSEPVRRLQSHRVLAINRGEKEGKLKVALEADENEAIAAVTRAALHPKNPFGDWLRAVCADSWNRLLFPSLERETRSELTDAANEQAIHNFALNLRPLLLQPPVRGRVTLGFDPAYRTGCKLAVVDATGKVLETAVIYPTPPHNKTEEAKRILRRLCDRHSITCIAIGNGTASKESEIFVADFIREYGGGIAYMVVSEAGRIRVFGLPAGCGGISGFRCFAPLGGVHRAAPAGSARRAGQNRPKRPSAWGQYQHDMPQTRPVRNAGRRGRGLRQRGRCGPEYRLPCASAPCCGRDQHGFQKYCRIPRAEWPLRKPQAAAQGQGAWTKGV